MGENNEIDSITFPFTIVGGGGEVAQLLGPNGKMKLADGRVFDTPSAAATALKGVKAINGWRFWKGTNGRPLNEIRDTHPYVFQNKREIKPPSLWRIATMNVDQEAVVDHGPCIQKWKDLITQCGKHVFSTKRAIHPSDVSKPAACFMLLSPLTDRDDVFIPSMILLSRVVSQTTPEWAFRTIIRFNGSEVCCYACDDVDVTIQSLNMEQATNIITTFNTSILAKYGLHGKVEHRSTKLVAKAMTIAPPDNLLKTCIRFTSRYSSCLFTFSSDAIRLHVYVSR